MKRTCHGGTAFFALFACLLLAVSFSFASGEAALDGEDGDSSAEHEAVAGGFESLEERIAAAETPGEWQALEQELATLGEQLERRSVEHARRLEELNARLAEQLANGPSPARHWSERSEAQGREWAAELERDGEQWAEWAEGEAERWADWAEEHGESWADWGERHGEALGEWGERFGESWADWGERFGETWAERAEQWAQRWAEWGERFAERAQELGDRSRGFSGVEAQEWEAHAEELEQRLDELSDRLTAELSGVDWEAFGSQAAEAVERALERLEVDLDAMRESLEEAAGGARPGIVFRPPGALPE